MSPFKKGAKENSMKAIITIDINQYENIKPEIEIDVDDLASAVKLVKRLHNKFHKCCVPVVGANAESKHTPEERVNNNVPF